MDDPLIKQLRKNVFRFIYKFFIYGQYWHHMTVWNEEYIFNEAKQNKNIITLNTFKIKISHANPQICMNNLVVSLLMLN